METPTETLRAHFARLLECERRANALTLDSMESVPPENHAGSDFQRALCVLSHIQLARRVWLARLGGESLRPADWFPAWPVAEIRSQSTELDNRWQILLGEVPDLGFEREVNYTSSEQIAYSSRVADIITHVVNHGSYHRGQVARMVHLAGGRRASTDFIALTRRQL